MLSQEYSITLVCDVLGCTRSSYYYRAEQPDETELKAALEAVATEWPTYGWRRLTAQLRRQGWVVNHKRVRRLMREMGLQVKIKRKRRNTTNSEHHFPRYPNLVQGLDVGVTDRVWTLEKLLTYRLPPEFTPKSIIKGH